MDWNLVLTAGTVSALVSASVGLFTTLLTLRLAKRKEKHTHLFDKLVEFRSVLYKIEPAASIDNALISGQISNAEFTELLEVFILGDDLYLKKYRPYFDTDLQRRIDRVREPIITWVYESGREIKKAELNEEVIEPPSFLPVLGDVASYMNLLTDITDEQIKRIKV